MATTPCCQPEQQAEIDRLRATSALSDDEEQAVLVQRVKQHRQSIDAFRKGKRADLVQAEEAQLAIDEAYLPEQLDAAARRRSDSGRDPRKRRPGPARPGQSHGAAVGAPARSSRHEGRRGARPGAAGAGLSGQMPGRVADKVAHRRRRRADAGRDDRQRPRRGAAAGARRRAGGGRRPLAGLGRGHRGDDHGRRRRGRRAARPT